MAEGKDVDLEAWIRTFRGPLIGLLASLGNGWGLAEELAQETFARAWLARARFRGDPADTTAVGAWLRGIAIRLASEARRRAPQASLPPAELPAPEGEDALGAERRERLRAAFAELGEPHRTVLRMHYLEGSSAREVAALLGITPKAVEDRLYQARKALRARLERHARRDAGGVRP
jgi:RNA polymerase sigma-70 factor (ECF subfamily)